MFLFSLLLSLSIVFVESQEKKSGCHQSCLILVVQISLLFFLRIKPLFNNETAKVFGGMGFTGFKVFNLLASMFGS